MKRLAALIRESRGSRLRWSIIFLGVVVVAALAGAAVWAPVGRGVGEAGVRPPVPAAVVDSLDTAFRDATGRENTLLQALIADPNAAIDGSDVFAEDIVWVDPTAGTNVSGRIIVMSGYRQIAQFGGQRQLLGWYVGNGGGVFIDGWSDVFDWTKQKLGRELFQIGLRDRLWASMLQLYDRGALTEEFARVISSGPFEPKLLSAFPKLMARYARSWSSRDPAVVAGLYAKKAVRRDLVFGDVEQGRTAIRGFAARFFGWYPGVQVRLVHPFGVGHLLSRNSRPAMGAELSILSTGTDGRPCSVKALTSLETKDGLITSEKVYYDAASLEACGWAS